MNRVCGEKQMNLTELIKKLKEIENEKGGDIICCTYDSVLEDYTENLCLEIVDDDYYLDENNEPKEDKIILF